MELEEGDLVICVVERMEKTVVFVKIPLKGKEIDGSIVTSEIAPGRIRNIRDYVFPKKRIVCKVLRISSAGNVELSFRRVSMKERKEVLEKEKKEKSYSSIFRGILGENSGKVLEEISKESEIVDFVERAKENPKLLEKYVGKNESKKIAEILKSQKEKRSVSKKEIVLKTTAPNGLEIIKVILGEVKGVETRYVSAGRYSLKAETNNAKESGRMIKEAEDAIEGMAKKQHVEFSIIEK